MLILMRKNILMQEKGKKMGQSVLEYALVLGIISAACIAMAMYVRRAVQGKVQTIESHITPESNLTPSY